MRTKLGLLSIIVFVCSVIGTWHFGYKYYWWIYYPSLGKTMGGPEYTTGQQHLWTYGLWISVILGVVSLINIIKLFVDGRRNLKR
ncbi:hypothetical protein [Alicyclobacillus fodiniaquatilis]|uniref:hypothetical protein n=1 Tax=Alicyclobacillus fodiniaquatilis TaxID=1661150 RepID=UPI00366E7B26